MAAQRVFGEFLAQAGFGFGRGGAKRQPAQAAVCRSDYHPAEGRAGGGPADVLAFASLRKACGRHAQLRALVSAARRAVARLIDCVGHCGSLFERVAQGTSTEGALVLQRAYAEALLEEALYGERA